MTTERRLNNELYCICDHDNDGISSYRYLESLTFYFLRYIEYSVVDTEVCYEYVNNITVTDNSGKMYVSYFM